MSESSEISRFTVERCRGTLSLILLHCKSLSVVHHHSLKKKNVYSVTYENLLFNVRTQEAIISSAHFEKVYFTSPFSLFLEIFFITEGV